MRDHRRAGDLVCTLGSADFMRVPLPAARTMAREAEDCVMKPWIAEI
jgi:hypothetical protein